MQVSDKNRPHALKSREMDHPIFDLPPLAYSMMRYSVFSVSITSYSLTAMEKTRKIQFRCLYRPTLLIDDNNPHLHQRGAFCALTLPLIPFQVAYVCQKKIQLGPYGVAQEIKTIQDITGFRCSFLKQPFLHLIANLIQDDNKSSFSSFSKTLRGPSQKRISELHLVVFKLR